jgi:hypothetical protein
MFAVQRIRQQRIQLEETLYFDHQKRDGQLRKVEIQKLKKNLNTQQQMFNTQRTQHHRIVKASFDIW